MDCPKCKSAHHVKDGIVGGRQRYQCKSCRFRYTVARKSDVKSLETRRLAFELYLAGISVRSIGKILKISYRTIYVWVKGWGSQASLLRGVIPVRATRLDQLLSHIASKQPALQHRLLLIDLDDKLSLLSIDNL